MILLSEHLDLEDVLISLNAISKRAEQRIEQIILSHYQDMQDEGIIMQKFDEYSKHPLIDSKFLNGESPEEWLYKVLII